MRYALFGNHSLKWQFLAICVILVVMPVTVLGMLAYNSVRARSLSAVETTLQETVADWRDVLTADAGSTPEETARRAAVLDQMGKRRLSGDAYLWVVDGRGRYVLSPQRRRDGEDLSEDLDAYGNRVIANLLTKARQRPEAISVDYYSWIGEGAGQSDKVVAYVYLPRLDWLLAASSGYDDATLGLINLRNLVLTVSAFSVVLGSLIGYLFAMMLTLPLTRLERFAATVTTRGLGAGLDEDLLSMRDEVGSLARSFNMMTTSLDRSERALRHERDNVASIISSMAEGLIVTDENRRVTLCNGAAATLLGLSAAETVGRSLDDVMTIRHKTDASAGLLRRTVLEPVLARGEVVHLDIADDYLCTRRAGAGAVFPVALVAAPLVGSASSDGVVIVFQDVTEAKSLEDARRSFISLASHQLQTPIVALRWIFGLLESGEAGALSAEQRGQVADARAVIEKMDGMVKLLLQIARIEMGRVRVVPTSQDLETLVQRVVVTLHPEMEKKHQQVRLTATPSPLATVMLDADIVWQVVSNLLSNASKYSPDGSVIEVRIAERGDDFLCEVEDHGMGIPADQQGMVFSRFFRATNALSSSTPGSGLGLSLARQLVESWGGRLWFESVEGVGTTFRFTLPRAGMKPREGEVKITV